VSTPSSIRIFHIIGNETSELASVPFELPAKGFLWLACTRSYFSEQLGSLQLALQKLSGAPLVDLHVSDLLNAQLPSHYDYTSQYDLLVIRRLASTPSQVGTAALAAARRTAAAKPLNEAPRISTTPVGFAAWERVLLSVHPEDCTVRDGYARRLLQFAKTGTPPLAAEAPDLGQISDATQERLAREDKAFRNPGSSPTPDDACGQHHRGQLPGPAP